MKTVLIWDTLGIQPIKFAILEGDYRHLNDVYVNSTGAKEEDDITRLMYGDNGECKIELTDTFPVDAVINGAFVIVAGFLP